MRKTEFSSSFCSGFNYSVNNICPNGTAEETTQTLNKSVQNSISYPLFSGWGLCVFSGNCVYQGRGRLLFASETVS